MPQTPSPPFKVQFIVSSASGLSTLAAIWIVEHLTRGSSHLLDLAATGGGILLAWGLVYALTRLVVPPSSWATRPPRPLSRPGRLELVIGMSTVIVVAIASRLWLGIGPMLTVPLLYVPLALLWLRRELVREGGT